MFVGRLATSFQSLRVPQLQYKRAKGRRFELRRRSRRLFLTSSGRSGSAGGGEEPRDRRPLYISPPNRLGLVWLGLYFFVSMRSPIWISCSCPPSTGTTSASAWSPPVATSDVAPSVNKRRYVVYTLSGFGMGIFLLLCLGLLVPPLSWDSELFTTLEATDAWCLGGLPVRSTNQGFVVEFNMPTIAAGKNQ